MNDVIRGFRQLLLPAAQSVLALFLLMASLPGFADTTIANPRWVAGGTDVACSLDDNGVHCWGDSSGGENNVPPLTNPGQLGVGYISVCALDSVGVHCWGDNSFGLQSVPTLSHPKQLSVDYGTACALDDSGVHCWGDNTYGQLRVPTLSHPWMVRIGMAFGCAIDDTGVHCWGNNGRGELNVPALSNPWQIATGAAAGCALDDIGAHCWGDTQYGIPNNVPPLSHPRQVAVGDVFACALDDSGVHCWGDNSYGDLNVPSLINPRQIVAGDVYACALDDTGIKCWGDNTFGQTSVPTQSITRYLSADVDHFLNDPSSPLQVLQSYLAISPGPPVTFPQFIHTTSLAPGQTTPAYTVQRDPLTGTITSITISSNDAVAPLPDDFWYAIGQVVFEAIQGPTDDPSLRCVTSNGDPYSFITLRDVFIGEQSDACGLRESFVQAFMMFVSNSSVGDITSVQAQIDQGLFPIGLSRRELMFRETIAAVGVPSGSAALSFLNVFGLLAIDATIGRLYLEDERLENLPQDVVTSTVYVAPPPIEAIAEQLRQRCSPVPGYCDGSYLTGEDYVESGALCREIEVGPSGSYQLKYASCAETHPVLCQAINSSGTAVSWVTTSAAVLASADSACQNDGTHLSATVKQAVTDPSQSFVVSVIKTQSIDSYLDIGPDSEALCVVLQKTSTTSTSTKYSSTAASAAKSCETKARIVCQNLNNASDKKVTSASYALADADAACVAEFGKQKFGNGPVFYSGTDATSFTMNGTSDPGTLGTGTIQSSDGSRKRMRDDSENSNDSNEVVALDTQLRSFEAAHPNNAFLIVHSLNVGAGSCHAVQCIAPGATSVQTALLDCGSDGYRQLNADGTRTAYALSSYGALEYLVQTHAWDDPRPTIVVSHPNRDHYRYIKNVALTKKPTAIYLGGTFGAYMQTFQDWIGNRSEEGVPIYVNGATDQAGNPLYTSWTSVPNGAPNPSHLVTFGQCGNASLDVLAVNQGNMGAGDVDTNQASAVLQLTYSNSRAVNFFQAIFPGDALGPTEQAAQANLSASVYTNRLLIASHHGSSEHNSNSQAWLSRVSPTEAVYSAGQRFGHPFCNVVTSYENLLPFAGAHAIQCSANGLYMNPPVQFNDSHYGTRLSGSIIAAVAIPSNAAPVHVLLRENQ